MITPKDVALKIKNTEEQQYNQCCNIINDYLDKMKDYQITFGLSTTERVKNRLLQKYRAEDWEVKVYHDAKENSEDWTFSVPMNLR